MLLRQLRYFATVAEQGSVMRAATKLRLAQPALSRQLQSLESAVGTSLLNREPRGMRLTPPGAALLATIQPLFGRIEEALRRVELANEGRLGTLRVGLGRVALDNQQVGRALMALREEFPDVNVVVSEVGSQLHREKLRAGELDLAIGLDINGHDGVAIAPLSEIRVDSAVLPIHHPLARADSLTVAQLRAEHLLVVDPSIVGPFPELFDQLRRIGLSEWNFLPSVESVYTMVAAGRGWTVSPGIRANPPAGTVVLPIQGFSVPMTIMVRWRRDDESPLMANVAPFLRRSANGKTGARAPSPRVKSAARAEGVPPGLDVQHLRALVATVELGSFSRAAERLGMTQSGLSRQIRSMERDIGVSLLRRKSNGVVATAAGEVLRDEAQRVLSLVEDAFSQARQVKNGVAGRCSIGAVATEFSGEIITAALTSLSDRQPSIDIEVTEMLTLQQVQALREGRIDLGVAGANTMVTDDPLIAGVRLVEDAIECALVAETHPLASRNRLEPSDLADVPFMFLDRQTYPQFYDIVMEAFAAIGLVPRIAGAFNGPRALWRSAADSRGWTLGSRSMLARPLAGMVAVPIEGLHIPSGIQLLWRRDESNPAVLSVRDAFRRRG